MRKNEEMQITLQPTVPFGCYGDIGMVPESNTHKCNHSIHLYYPEVTEEQCAIDETALGSLPKINNRQAVCGAEIKGFFAYDTREDSSPNMSAVTLNITSPFFSISDPTVYKLGLITQHSGSHKIWQGSTLDEIQLTISNGDYEPRVCYAHVDPHMWTFTQRDYDINNFAGDFILYKHNVLGIEIQMRTTKCNNNRAYCACAVAVRAGGDVFLINLCGKLRDVGMTSCKDGGSLVIQQDDEYNYHVFTNIGTLVKIKILSGHYKNLLNIDVHLAPKDVGATKGLCGTYNGTHKKEQYMSRAGTSLSRKAFIKEWIVRSTDTNFLDKSCDIPVEAWQESGQSLYCTCDCYSKKRKTCSNIPVATCSPTQYVNCSISFSKATEFCEYYYDDCDINRNGRRSASYYNPGAEMARRAHLSRLSHRFITKRETASQVNISEDMAREFCTNKIVTRMVTEREQLLNGMKLENVIEECTWDVFTGGDIGWADIHQASTFAMIEAGYKRDANLTLTNAAEFREFKINTCPNNCSGNGHCTNKGKCECEELYFGPECAQNKSIGPLIEDITGGGFCDQRYGSECRCFFVQTEALLNSFRCRIVRYEKFLNGETAHVGTETTNGRHRNIYNGDCCFGEMRRKRASDSNADSDVMNYVYDISISNDGQTFGPSTSVYIYDSLCLTKQTERVGNVTFKIKDNTCLISGTCQVYNAAALSNPCYKCIPGKSQIHWTYDCNHQQVSTTAIVVVVAMGTFVLFILIACTIVYSKKTKQSKRLIFASNDFTSKIYNEPAKPVFNSKTL